MLDKSIPYYDVLMVRKKGTLVKDYKLPEGFEFVLFKSGDEIIYILKHGAIRQLTYTGKQVLR
jgi:hypothetical protein